MSVADFQRVRAVFLAARDLGPADRAAVLGRECGDDDALRAEVESLLAHHDAGRHRPTTPVAGSAVEAVLGSATVETPLPRDFGGFELLEVIGRGGMGTVYRARQRTPDRTVAVKVIRPDMMTRAMMERFRYEADVLARLQHPGIAQIFEAGTVAAADGVEEPYFALELVAGQAIADYAVAHDLDVAARLAIIVKVCEAVHHAHQKGVIHRDLKPANILVHADGQPKVLDFGVARVTDADVRTTTLRTSVGQLVGTLPYMSPEQVSGDPARLDLRSDVYALGVLIFELLGRRPPYDLRDKTIADAALAIRDQEPPRLGTIAPALRGDLENIVAKTLEKEPARRYDSAAALAEDLRRHLAHQPIVARPPSVTYQLRLFARRHRALVAGAAIGVAALVIATVVSLVFAVRAQRAADEESRQRQIAERTNEHLEQMLTAPSPHRDGEELTVVEMLERTVTQLDDAGELPEVEARVRRAIGDTYLGMRRYDDAIAQLARAAELYRAIDPHGRDLAHALGPLATARSMVGDNATAEREYRETIPLLERYGEAENLAKTRRGLVDVLVSQRKYAEAEPAVLAMLDDARRSDRPVQVIAVLRRMARLYVGLQRYEDAERVLGEARALSERHLPESHPMYNAVLLDVSVARRNAGDFEGALAASREAHDLARRVRRPGSGDWMLCVGEHADLLETFDRRDELRTVLTEARAALVSFDPDHASLVEIDERLARLEPGIPPGK